MMKSLLVIKTIHIYTFSMLTPVGWRSGIYPQFLVENLGLIKYLLMELCRTMGRWEQIHFIIVMNLSFIRCLWISKGPNLLSPSMLDWLILIWLLLLWDLTSTQRLNLYPLTTSWKKVFSLWVQDLIKYFLSTGVKIFQ